LQETGVPMAVVATESTVGGGSLPGQTLPTQALAIEVPSPDALAARLRHPACSRPSPWACAAGAGRPSDQGGAPVVTPQVEPGTGEPSGRGFVEGPPIVARIENDRLLLDPRTVLPEQDAALIRIVRAALAAECPRGVA